MFWRKCDTVSHMTRTTENDFPSIEETFASGNGASDNLFINLESWPRSRIKHSCSLCGSYMYVFGGRDNNVGLKDSWRYNIERHSWEKLELLGMKLPYLEGHTSTAFEDQIFIFGGNFESDASNPMWIMDTHNFECSNVKFDGEEKLVPVSRRGHTACLFEKDLYIFGGFVDFLGSTDELWKFSLGKLDSPRWELLYSGQNIFKFCSQKSLKNQLEKFVDLSHNNNDNSNNTGNSNTNNFIQSQNSTNNFLGPGLRYYHACTVLEDSMFVHGGVTNNRVSNSFWKWGFATNKWSLIKSKPLPPPLKKHSLVAINSTSLLLLGGESDDMASNVDLGDFNLWIFDAHISNWCKVTNAFGELSKTVSLTGFVALNITDLRNKADNLSLVTLWNDGKSSVSLPSFENLTETTNSDDSVCTSTAFTLSTVTKTPLQSNNNDYRSDGSSTDDNDNTAVATETFYSDSEKLLIDNGRCFQRIHREAVQKLSGYDLSSTIPRSSRFSPLRETKVSVLGDIEMDNFDDGHRLIQQDDFDNKLLSFDNKCFSMNENSNENSTNYNVPNERVYGYSLNSKLNRVDIYSDRTDRVGENVAYINTESDNSLSFTCRKIKQYKIALIGGNQRSKREFTTSPLSMTLLEYDDLSCEIKDVLLF